MDSSAVDSTPDGSHPDDSGSDRSGPDGPNTEPATEPEGTGPRAMDRAFLPGEGWVGVSPQLGRLRRVLLAASTGVAGTVGAGAAVALAAPWVGALVAAVALVTGVTGWVFIGRNTASWRYAERDDDLLISHGVVFRELVVVPYGRMQFVDVTAGPLERWFGIATVQLHTAAATTDARIPGTPPEEAARLRDRLSALGEARSAGL
jgi:uncharacterized protein